jgi:putative ABC transport system ATP-binding protein
MIETTGREILRVLRALPEPGRRSVVMVTHDPQAAQSGDRLVQIRDGRVETIQTLRGRHALAASNA